MVRTHKIYALVLACLVPFFSNAMTVELEKNELEKTCEQAVQQDNIESLNEFYKNAIKELQTDERYEMERQRGNVLAYAAFFGHEQVVKDLLARSFDPNERSYYGSCPLLFAIGRGQFKIVQLLLDAGADAESCNGYGESAESVAKAFPFKVIKEQMLDILRMYGAEISEGGYSRLL